MKRRKNQQLFNKINASSDFLRLKENAESLWLHYASGKEMCLRRVRPKASFQYILTFSILYEQTLS